MIVSFPTLSCRLSAWLVAAIACVATLHAADRKPNFLFIYTDDQRWDAMGVVQREQGERARFPWFNSPIRRQEAEVGARCEVRPMMNQEIWRWSRPLHSGSWCRSKSSPTHGERTR